jgi:hypothetical protein
MSKTRNFEAKPTKDAISEQFGVDNWPETVTEAVDVWGDKRVQFCIDGTSAIVQAQGRYRTLRTRKENKLSAVAAANEMKSWKPSEGERERLTAGEKVKRGMATMSEAECIQTFVDMGLTKEQATAAAKRVGA